MATKLDCVLVHTCLTRSNLLAFETLLSCVISRALVLTCMAQSHYSAVSKERRKTLVS